MILHRFWEGLGEGFGRVLDVKIDSRGVQEQFIDEAEKKTTKRRASAAKVPGLAVGVMGSGKEELGPELALKSNTPLHPSVGRGRRILKREALCRQLPLTFWRLEGGQIRAF